MTTAEHRREPGVDHPRALRHPADGEAVAATGSASARGRSSGSPRARRRRRPARAGRPRRSHAGEHASRAAAERRSRRSRGRRPAPGEGRAPPRPRPQSPPRRRSRARPWPRLRRPSSRRLPAARASSRCRRETMTGAACTRFVVQTAAPTAGAPSGRARGREPSVGSRPRPRSRRSHVPPSRT